MTVATRDQIMDAVISLLQANANVADLFPTISRRFLMWEQVKQKVQQGGEPLRQPALFLFDGVGLGGGIDRIEQRGRGTPARVTMLRTIVMYAMLPKGGTPDGSDYTTPGGSVFYPLIEAVTTALGTNPDPSQGTLTLDGLVSHCWLSGDSIIVTGEIDPDGQGMATLPLNIMLYPSL